MWYWGDGMMWWMGLGFLFFVLFWGAVIWLIVWVVRQATSKGGSSAKNALDIARERYARGEITKEQFEQFKKDLT